MDTPDFDRLLEDDFLEDDLPEDLGDEVPEEDEDWEDPNEGVLIGTGWGRP